MRAKTMAAGAALAIIVLSVSWKSGWLEAAQEPALLKPGSRIAIVDLTRIYAHHVDFKQKVDLMRIDVQQAEMELKASKEALEALKNSLEKEPIGSAERAEAQLKLDLDTQALQLQVNQQKARFMKQEAQIYIETYDRVLGIIATYAEKQGIELVLRFNGEPIDRNNNLQNVMQQLNRQVVFNNKRIDITDEILRQANAK